MVIFVCNSLSVLVVDYFVWYTLLVYIICSFIVLDLVSSVLRQQIAWEERLRVRHKTVINQQCM